MLFEWLHPVEGSYPQSILAIRRARHRPHHANGLPRASEAFAVRRQTQDCVLAHRVRTKTEVQAVRRRPQRPAIINE